MPVLATRLGKVRVPKRAGGTSIVAIVCCSAEKRVPAKSTYRRRKRHVVALIHCSISLCGLALNRGLPTVGSGRFPLHATGTWA